MPSDERTVAPSAADGFEPTLKLHPASWFFVAVHHIKQFVLAIVAAAVAGSNADAGLWWPLWVVVPLVAAAIWHQWVFRYGFSDCGLVIREGLFFRTVRTVDYERIENVDTERSLLHRLFGVAVVRVETSSGGKPEALICVLSVADVAKMREHIFARLGTRDAATRTDGADPHTRLATKELRERIEEAIRALPARQQQVITLRDLEGWSAEEVCEALDLTPANQRVLLHRARMKVRDALFTTHA